MELGGANLPAPSKISLPLKNDSLLPSVKFPAPQGQGNCCKLLEMQRQLIHATPNLHRLPKDSLPNSLQQGI
jgi:hypothetical protein